MMKLKNSLFVVVFSLILMASMESYGQVLTQMSGRVTDSQSVGIQGVYIDVIATGGPCSQDWYGNTTTNLGGYYTIMVPLYCSNIVTPSKHLWSFDPPIRIVEDFFDNIDFTGSQ